MGFLPPLMMTGLFLGLLLKEPELGTAAIFGATALGMMFVAGTRTSYILLLVLTAAPIGWKVFISGESWRMKRILAYLYPWQYRRDIGYQLYESLISVGSGGVWGQGLGQGHQKLFFLPEAHTDFILAVVGEELGLVGILAVLATFGILVWRGIRAAMRARDPYGCYLAFGITSLFGLQAVVNMCVVLGLLPTKGLPLPFVSYGGSALVMSHRTGCRGRTGKPWLVWAKPRNMLRRKRLRRSPGVATNGPEIQARLPEAHEHRR
jgi:cell division protein FtsW